MNIRLAMVFPGQGSQSVGMLAELAKQHPSIGKTFQQASQILNYDLWNLVQEGPEDALNQTWRTQPALLTASVALWNVWQQMGGRRPQLMAGHSLGEYSALVCAGVIKFEDGVRLVELRGRLMQEAVPQGVGAMYAIIGLADSVITQACNEAAQDQIVAPVNYNSPGQVVIAGHRDAVERAAVLCKAAGAKRALPLPVSVPSHCALMKPAAEQLARALASIPMNVPEFPVINNVDVAVESEPEAIRDALIRQLYSPVRWAEVIEKMASEGIDYVAELGPNKVLTGLTRRIVEGLSAVAINDPITLAGALDLSK